MEAGEEEMNDPSERMNGCWRDVDVTYVLRKSQEDTSDGTNLGQSVLDTPDLTLVLQTCSHTQKKRRE